MAATMTPISREILEDRWANFVCEPVHGRFRPEFLAMCRALNTAVDEVARIPHDDDTAPLEGELVHLVHEFIVRRAGEGLA